ncbi:MAG: hypothetical protein K2M27_05775 [Muribaculaceae bacterium]|nr:hypothetical protein [Muribaculaceae bacterium]
MRVVTLSDDGFRETCRRLAESCLGSGIRPDCVAGICTGGWIVAREMSRHFPEASLLSVTSRRPSTDRKGRMVRRVVRILPRFMQDWLRIMESRILAMADDGKAPQDAAGLSVDAAESLSAVGDGTILVVDDAIDSGKTMWRVVEAIRAAAPSAVIRTAAVTVTTGHPLVVPDVALYNDRTLIRFPWAMDA